MSYMINNGVDCEFSDIGQVWFLGKLDHLNEDLSRSVYYCDRTESYWAKCRPRMNEGLARVRVLKCPVPEGFTGKVWLGSGAIEEYHDLTQANWSLAVAFMVTGVAEGWELKQNG